HLGRETVCRPGVRLRRNRDRETERGGRGAHGQAGDGGVGGRRRVPAAIGIADGAGAEPVGPLALVGRILERLRGGGGGGPGAVRHRQRDVGIDRDAGGVLRGDRAAPYVRAGQPVWRDGALLDAG